MTRHVEHDWKPRTRPVVTMCLVQWGTPRVRLQRNFPSQINRDFNRDSNFQQMNFGHWGPPILAWFSAAMQARIVGWTLGCHVFFFCQCQAPLAVVDPDLNQFGMWKSKQLAVWVLNHQFRKYRRKRTSARFGILGSFLLTAEIDTPRLPYVSTLRSLQRDPRAEPLGGAAPTCGSGEPWSHGPELRSLVGLGSRWFPRQTSWPGWFTMLYSFLR